MLHHLLPQRKRKDRDAESDLPPVGNRDRRFRGLFAGTPLITALVIVSVFALLIFLHSQFMARVGQCREVYHTNPDMQVIDEQQSYFLQPFGSLRTELYSPDAPGQVREWLSRSYVAEMREAVTSGNFTNMPEQSWTVIAVEDGGSRITLTCP